MIVKIKKLYEDAVIPTYGTDLAAACDLYSHFDNNTTNIMVNSDGREYIEVHPHCTVKIGSGIAIEPPDGYCSFILARSGMATKFGLAPANKIGLCDSDYRGEIFIPMLNHTNTIKRIYNHERIAQLMFAPYEQANFKEVISLSETERGAGGFGSTGTM